MGQEECVVWTWREDITVISLALWNECCMTAQGNKHNTHLTTSGQFKSASMSEENEIYFGIFQVTQSVPDTVTDGSVAVVKNEMQQDFPCLWTNCNKVNSQRPRKPKLWSIHMYKVNFKNVRSFLYNKDNLIFLKYSSCNGKGRCILS